MESNVVEGSYLPYVLVKPQRFAPDGSWPLIVMLHGFGASMYDLASVAPALDATGYAYAFPNAPYAVSLGYGNVGYSWQSDRPGVQPTSETRSVDELLDGTLAEITAATGARPGSILLGGFSQGASMTLRLGLPRPETFAGLFMLSGLLRDPGTIRLPAEHTQPVFVAHGRQDTIVPIAHAHETKRFLEEAGYPLAYHEYDMPHTITDEEIADLRPWLRATLPPKA